MNTGEQWKDLGVNIKTESSDQLEISITVIKNPSFRQICFMLLIPPPHFTINDNTFLLVPGEGKNNKNALPCQHFHVHREMLNAVLTKDININHHIWYMQADIWNVFGIIPKHSYVLCLTRFLVDQSYCLSFNICYKIPTSQCYFGVAQVQCIYAQKCKKTKSFLCIKKMYMLQVRILNFWSMQSLWELQRHQSQK